MAETMCCPLSGNDGEGPTVHQESRPRAAKEYSCTECRKTIRKGEHYELVKGMWDKHWSTYRTCLLCVEIRNHFACEGWIYEQLRSDLEENFFPDMKAGGPCMEGLSPAAKQKLIDERMEWYLGQDEVNDSRWDGWKPPSSTR